MKNTVGIINYSDNSGLVQTEEQGRIYVFLIRKTGDRFSVLCKIVDAENKKTILETGCLATGKRHAEKEEIEDLKGYTELVKHDIKMFVSYYADYELFKRVEAKYYERG